MKRLVVVFACLALLVLSEAPAVLGQGPSGPDLERRVRALTDRLNCPLCQGQTLTECPLQICNEMRDLIRTKLAAGETEAEVSAYFVERFGDRVLNEPPRRGFALLGWLAPLAGLLVGIAVVVWALRGMTRRPAPQTTAPTVPEALPREYVERLERDLRQME
jgi:cytochrome c-type biogenesis protein CcmH